MGHCGRQGPGKKTHIYPMQFTSTFIWAFYLNNNRLMNIWALFQIFLPVPIFPITLFMEPFTNGNILATGKKKGLAKIKSLGARGSLNLGGKLYPGKVSRGVISRGVFISGYIPGGVLYTRVCFPQKSPPDKKKNTVGKPARFFSTRGFLPPKQKGGIFQAQKIE